MAWSELDFRVLGGIHGGWLAIERYLTGGDPEWLLRRGLGWAGRTITLLIAGLAWVFFRAPSLSGAFSFLAGIGHFVWQPGYGAALIYLAALSGVMLLIDGRMESAEEEYPFQHSALPVPVSASLALAAIIVLFGAMDTSAFIYFQF